jgi:hypothetical protein
MRECPKCGDNYDTQYCPKDGTKLKDDPFSEIAAYFHDAATKARKFLENNAAAESPKIQKGLVTRETKMQQYEEWSNVCFLVQKYLEKYPDSWHEFLEEEAQEGDAAVEEASGITTASGG